MTFEEAITAAADQGLRLERLSQPYLQDMFCAMLLGTEATAAEAAAAKWNPKLWGYGATPPEAILDAVKCWDSAQSRAWAPLVAALDAALEART